MAKTQRARKAGRSGALKTAGIAFIGGGNMAEALIRGLLEAGIAGAGSICVSDVAADRLTHLRDRYRVRTTADNAEAAGRADIVFLAVKPQNMEEALEAVAPGLKDSCLVVSIMAGVPTHKIEDRLGGKGRVVRVMPNAAALVGQGAAGVAGGKRARGRDVETVVGLLGSVGRAIVVNEAQMDAVTGLSGSGPAYAAVVIEALADGGVLMGLPRETALRLAAQTVAGTAAMVLEAGEHPGRIKDQVASPGGTTIEGLAALEDGGLRGILIRAVEAATLRSRELGRKG
ncbi:MAG: pyrroline-5-carboxylate reductase [Nitrospinota bacterium]|jgi:pyrroline-5-carboxylate reductase|nr:pyrroline-5-carboxylate reductase [Nitrospinota bacterium]MDP7385938.1 pyrroline-5-carboxylate reductase [Nitrospinota bacterium]HJM41900.1 pyrroline-5-carboxylate reductase [Nitrospinota bacterium]